MYKKPKKVLIIRLGAIGDVVHTTIIATAIKEKHPDWQIHYLTSKRIKPILENHPHIDKIHEWDRANRKSKKHLFEVGFMLMKERYDIVFNLTYVFRNFILGLMTLCPHIVYRQYSKKSWVYDFFLTAKKGVKDITQPERLYLGTDSDITKKLKENLSEYPRPYVIFTPGGATNNNRQGRMWNIEKWKELSEYILKKYGGTIFICGSSGEKTLHETIGKDNSRIKILSGQYNLKESSNLFSLADLMISGDTGPLHIASAHNIKTLAILGSTSPDKIKPYGENGYYISANTECKYCWGKRCKFLKSGEKYTPCMELITANMVMKKIEEEHLL